MFFAVENSKNLVDKGEIALACKKELHSMVNWQRAIFNFQISRDMSQLHCSQFPLLLREALHKSWLLMIAKNPCRHEIWFVLFVFM